MRGPSAPADQADRRPTLGAMTQPSTVPDVAPAPVIRGRRFHIIVAVLLLVGLVWSGYILKFGQCDAESKFCVVHVAGTRSDVGCEWDSWSCYVTTDGVEPSTHVFLHFGG
jgi:hypothetical protein